MSQTPEQYQNSLERMKKEIATIVVNAPFVQSQELTGVILQRVFNEGKDTSGNDIGQYAGADSKSKGRYKALRNRKGLRIDKVDLQFTGAMMKSIVNGQTQDGAEIGFNNTELAKIGSYNEERYKKDVFAPSATETENARALMVDYVKEELKNKIKNIFSGG